MATKIYIAGKITGDPDYKAKFNAAAEAYKKKGYTVLNPSWMPQGMQQAPAHSLSCNTAFTLTKM